MNNNELLERLEDMGAEVDDVVERLGGDRAIYIDYLHQLAKDDSIIKLRQAVEANDAKRAEDAVHTLKGISLNLGLLPLTDVCMDMLLDFRAGNVAEAMGQLGAVEECYQEWVKAILA